MIWFTGRGVYLSSKRLLTLWRQPPTTAFRRSRFTTALLLRTENTLLEPAPGYSPEIRDTTMVTGSCRGGKTGSEKGQDEEENQGNTLLSS